MSRECFRLSVSTGCLWHGCGAPCESPPVEPSQDDFFTAHVQSVACLAKKGSRSSSPPIPPACCSKSTPLFRQIGGRSATTDHQAPGTASTMLRRSAIHVPC